MMYVKIETMDGHDFTQCTTAHVQYKKSNDWVSLGPTNFTF